jgi:ABC-type Zn uptake system ZnuABC Zn-binding protein ZnuA
MEMTEEKKPWDQESFDQKMKESLNELSKLRMELQNLLVKFGLRALKTYQAARNYPLRANEIARLVKYEIENAIQDVSAQDSKDAIIKQTRIEWEKTHEVAK